MAERLNDGELLARFARAGEEPPFQELLQRHGGMVLEVCRRVLGNAADAEDAAQAVFLTLAQKAKDFSLQRSATLGGWLHKLAWNVAMRVRTAADVRKQHEREATAMGATKAEESADYARDWARLRPVLDEELASLPEKYRMPLVLCDLEGRSQEDAAAELAVPQRTLAHRLERTRLLLRKRLEHRGIALSVTALVALVTSNTGHAALSATFVTSTAKAASFAFAGNLAASGMASSHAISLAQQAVEMLFWSKLKAAGVACLLTILVALTGVTSYLAIAQEHPPKVASPKAEAPAVQGEKPAEKPKQYPSITVTPHGADASIVFEELGRKGLHALGLNTLQHQWGTALSHLLIPVVLRLKPVDGRQLIEAVASARGLKVAWVRDDKYAVLHTGAADTEVLRVRNDLESKDARVRNDAAWRGGWLRDVRAVPLLIKATKDPDAEVARQALAGLRKMNWEAVLALDQGAAEVVARELDSRDNMIRREASFALGLLGWEKALPLLEKALADDDDIVRHHAVRALGQIGDEKALALLERTLADKQSRSSITVVEALGSIRGEKELALLEKTLADEERIVRYHAAEALGRIGGEKALALLGNALPDTDPFFRSGVVVALGRVGGEKSLALLDKALTDPSLEMRRSAAVALGYAGCAGGVTGEKAFALLEKALTDHEAWVRSGAVWALVNIGGEKALALLEKALADADATVRSSAADALGDVGGEKALALLEKALADPNPRVGGRASCALGRIDGEKALALLEKALAYPDTLGEKHIESTRRQMDDVHQGAVAALGNLSWEESLTLLEKGLASPNVNLRWGAVAAFGGVSGMDGGVASALGNIGGDKALRLLEKALDDPDVQVREKAIYGLGLVGGEKALALLEKMLADPFVGERVELPHAGMVQVIIPRATVNFALGQVGGERARELLEKALADKDAWVRYSTAGALAAIGGGRACRTVLAALTAEKTKWGRSHIREVVEKHFGDLLEVKEALSTVPRRNVTIRRPFCAA